MNNTPGCFDEIKMGIFSLAESIGNCFSSCWEGREVVPVERNSVEKELVVANSALSEIAYAKREQIPLKKDREISRRTVLQKGEKKGEASKRKLESVKSLESGKILTEKVKDDPNFGVVTIQPFSPTWLKDYPQIVEHLHSEHLLHVKGLDSEGRGLTWHTEKFKTNMNPRFNPEAKVQGALKGGFQMKMGYFIVPKNKINDIRAVSLSEEVYDEITVVGKERSVEGYRFFVHPEAYDHFRSLHSDPSVRYISPEDSEYIVTPTSSYRSLVIRRVQENARGVMNPAKGSVPFIVKVGVGGSVLGSDRWLSTNEIQRSIQSQIAFDGMDRKIFNGEMRGGNPASELLIFSESMGMILKGIKHYPPPSEDKVPSKSSGVIIREFPKAMLEGNCKIVSMAALMSCEKVKKEHKKVCQLAKGKEEYSQLPLIYQIMEATICAKKAESPENFIQKYLIKGYIDAIEAVTFQEGMTLEPHSQNLCMVLNNDLTPRGFAYRDHGGIWVDIATRGLQNKDMVPFHRESRDGNALFKTKGAISKGYIGSYSWFYRYQVFIKTLNTITSLPKSWDGDKMPPFPGAPYQIGSKIKLEERNLNVYVQNQISKEKTNKVALKHLQRLSLTLEQSKKALNLLDNYYNKKLNSYFDMEKIAVPLEEGALPAAEGGSGFDEVMLRHKGFLGKYRFNNISSNSTRLSVEKIPARILGELNRNAITSFEGEKIEELGIKECILISQGVCFLDKSKEIVAFSPYSMPGEKKWIEKMIMPTQ